MRSADKGSVQVVQLSPSFARLTALGWEQYLKLLDEIGKLIGGDEESLPGTIVGVPVITTDSTQGVKILPKSPPS